MKIVCEICPHHCHLDEGQTGLCKARMNHNQRIVSKNYGKLTSIALDPIEKKPLRRFYPGKMILSVGSFGCNLRCPFCQNWEISFADERIETVKVSPEFLADKAVEMKPYGNIGLAYTYNEPLVGYEFVYDCARLVREKGLKNVVVTNGMCCEGPLKKLLPWIDAMNIDLKGFSSAFYKKIGGDFETVKRSIELANDFCHVEVTNLIIPGENDSVQEMMQLAQWLSSINPEIPLHISRFFPRWKMNDRKPTPIETIDRLAEAARRYLKYVYKGNC